jgi:hypothetical protein
MVTPSTIHHGNKPDLRIGLFFQICLGPLARCQQLVQNFWQNTLLDLKYVLRV